MLVLRRMTCLFSFRFQSTSSRPSTKNILDLLNRIKIKDLTKILSEKETRYLMDLKRSLGGKFQSLEQLDKSQINFDKLSHHLLATSENGKNERGSHRLLIEPRLTPKSVAAIESVCSVDYTASHINWTILTTDNQHKQYKVNQWNSIRIDLDRKFNFLKTFNKLSHGLLAVPLSDASVILVEDTTYRYSTLQLATYVAQLQEIRAIFATLLHCRSESRPVYHISGRDVAQRFGLFLGNEQLSANLFLTRLLFGGDTKDHRTIDLDMDHQLKTNFHQTVKGQREAMAQCLLRALAFLEHVNEKKSSK